MDSPSTLRYLLHVFRTIHFLVIHPFVTRVGRTECDLLDDNIANRLFECHFQRPFAHHFGLLRAKELVPLAEQLALL